jgi:hypothetical protein
MDQENSKQQQDVQHTTIAQLTLKNSGWGSSKSSLHLIEELELALHLLHSYIIW